MFECLNVWLKCLGFAVVLGKDWVRQIRSQLLPSPFFLEKPTDVSFMTQALTVLKDVCLELALGTLC